MYYNTEDKHQFTEGERAGLRASAMYARLAMSRADADAQRIAMTGSASAEDHAYAMRERFRVAHREAMTFESELEDDDDEYGDEDEYGYAA